MSTDWDTLLTTKSLWNGRGRYPSTFGKLPTKLEVLIRSTGKHDYQVAADLSIPASHLSSYKTGKRIPNPDTLMRLSAYFHVDPKDILGYVNE